MRIATYILLCLTLILHLQAGGSMLGICVSDLEACEMEQEAMSCGCEDGSLPLSNQSCECPVSCLNCDLDQNIATVVSALMPVFRAIHVDVAWTACVLTLPQREWSIESMPMVATVEEAPPRLDPTTAWGVWRL